MICPSLRAAGESPSIPGFSLDDIDRRDNEILNLDLSPMSPDSPNAFEDVPPDHWAYKAVQYLAGIGFLEGYDGGQFRGDQVITRYELAVIVSRMLQNYNKFRQQGYIERNVPVDRDWPDAEEFPPPQLTYTPEPVRKARTLPQTVRIKKINEPPGLVYPAPEAYPTYIQQSPVPSLQPSSRAYTSGEMQLQTGPGTPGFSRIYYQAPSLAARQDTLRQSGPKSFAVDTKPATSTTEVKDTKDKAKDKDKGKEAKVKVPKELKKVADKFEVTEKDIAIFETLVKYVKDEMKSQKSEIKKDISEIKRMAKKNEGDIEKLEQENQRYKITGSAKYQVESTEYNVLKFANGTISTPAEDNRTSLSNSAWANASLYSKPRKSQDLVLTVDNETNLSGVHINYQDFTTNREHPKNFKLRGLYTGGTSLSFSPLSIFGKGITGFSTSMVLNKYELQAGWGQNGINTIYGTALKTSLFNNPASFLWISRLMSYQDKETVNPKRPENGVYGCARTDKAKDEGWDDRVYPIGSWRYKDVICLPPEKNSISSAFLQTPLPLKNWSIWFEYAHSTFYRQGFNLTMKNDKNSSMNTANPYKPSEKYLNWRPIKEQRSSDDAILGFLSYSKGPISIFPLGYARLGPDFVSTHFGLPGFDISSLSLSALPIKIQSLELFIFRPTITKTDDKYKIESTYVMGGEHKPMHLDMSGMASQADIINKFVIFDRLNNRGKDAMIRANVFLNTATYYISDNIQLSASYDRIKVALGPGCIDANVIETKDDQGNITDVSFGNGVANCTPGDPQKDEGDIMPRIRYKKLTQSMRVYWKTSKKADFNLSYSMSKDMPEISLGAGNAVDQALSDLLPKGTSAGYSVSLSYKLTDVSTAKMWYGKDFIPYPAQVYRAVDKVDKTLKDTVGFSLEMSF